MLGLNFEQGIKVNLSDEELQIISNNFVSREEYVSPEEVERCREWLAIARMKAVLFDLVMQEKMEISWPDPDNGPVLTLIKG